MINWDAAISGARVGAAIGAATGLVPLGIGYLCHKRKEALVGFAACIFAGAVGGVYAAIAIMAGSIAKIFQTNGRRYQKIGQQNNQWRSLATVSDKCWYLVGIVSLFICMFGTMFLSAAFLTPLVLGVPNNTPRDAVGKIVEPLMLFGGLGLGIIVGSACLSFISRRFISSKTHSQWARDYEAQAINLPPLLKNAMRICYQIHLPRERHAKMRQRGGASE